MSFEASIIVLTYNCEFEKLKKTLQSILNQERVSFEIIIADDGSKDNHAELIHAFFETHAFSQYKCVMNQTNQGTVANCLSGVNVAEGEYTKLISPGDYFCSAHVLRSWIDFVKEKRAEWSFSEAQYYDPNSTPVKVVSVKANPQVIQPYINRDLDQCRWNYVVLDDIALGATMLGKTDLQKAYLKKLHEKGIRFAEDNMFRLMMFDGVCGEYFPEITINYEYGTGISTGENSAWKEALLKDWDGTTELMAEQPEKDSFQVSMIKGIRLRKDTIKKIAIKGIISMWIHRHWKTRMTMCDVSLLN